MQSPKLELVILCVLVRDWQRRPTLCNLGSKFIQLAITRQGSLAFLLKRSLHFPE